MGLIQTALTNHARIGNSAWDSMLVRGLAQEGSFFRERLLAATARSLRVTEKKSDHVALPTDAGLGENAFEQ